MTRLSAPYDTEDKRFQTKYFRATRNSVIRVSLPVPTVGDDRLEDEDIGFLLRIFANADSWKIIPKYIAKQKNRGGINKVYAKINKLIKCGYAVRLVHREKLSDGRFGKQHFGYNFFDTQATKEDIEEAKEEFKKCYRNHSLRKHGHREHSNSDIEQYKEDTPTKETTPSIVDKSKLLPSSKRKEINYFHHSRKYLKQLTPSAIRSFKKYFEAQELVIENPLAWLTACAKGRWWEGKEESEQDKVLNHMFAERILANMDKLKMNNGNSFYLGCDKDKVWIVVNGKDTTVPKFKIPHAKFKERLRKLLVDKYHCDEMIFN